MQGFCPLKTEITQFPDGIRPKMGVSVSKIRYRTIFESNLAPLIRANTVQLPWVDLDARAEMSLSVG